MKWRNSKERELMKSKNVAKQNSNNSYDYSSKETEPNNKPTFDAEKNNKTYLPQLIEKPIYNGNNGFTPASSKISLNCCVGNNTNHHHNHNHHHHHHNHIHPGNILIPGGAIGKDQQGLSPSYNSASPRSSSCLTSPVSSAASSSINNSNCPKTNMYLPNNSSDVDYNLNPYNDEDDDNGEDIDDDDDDDDEDDDEEDGEEYDNDEVDVGEDFGNEDENVNGLSDAESNCSNTNVNGDYEFKSNYLKLKMANSDFNESRFGVNKCINSEIEKFSNVRKKDQVQVKK